MRLVHISDVHVGDSPRALLAEAAAAINALKPRVVVLSGDLTQSGSSAEYEEAAWFLGLFESPVVGTPGNHDAPVYNLLARVLSPFERFESLGLASSWKSLDPAVEIATLNTARAIQARADWSQGVYPEDAFESLLPDAERPSWRIVVAHHPPVSMSGALVRSDARRGARSWATLGRTRRTLLLCGHLHRFTIVHVPPLLDARMIVAPTLSCSRARRAGLGFVEMELSGPELGVRLHLHDGTAYAPALQVGDVLHNTHI